MAQIMFQLAEHDISRDCSLNPEILLMAAQEDNTDEDESLWLAGLAVTSPKTSKYDKE